MGKQFHIETRTMKFLVVLALVAAAYWYGNYWGTPSYYGGWGYSGYASPYWGGYYNRGYGYWKRDAEAKPEAEANPEAYWYGNAYGAWGNRWGYSGWYNRPYGYNWGYSGYRRYGGYWW